MILLMLFQLLPFYKENPADNLGFSERRILPFASVTGCLIYATAAILFFFELL